MQTSTRLQLTRETHQNNIDFLMAAKMLSIIIFCLTTVWLAY